MKKSIAIIILAVLIIALLVIMFYNASRPKGLVAFVIDDWGYNKRNIDLALEIDRPLTIAILPNLRYSKYVTEEFAKTSNVCDIILHLPLESKSNRAAEKGTIRSNMEQETIVTILEDGIDDVPGFIGVSNHQGSKASEDKRVMKIILGELKKRELFFLDSVTTPKSVCADIARDIKLRFSRRDVFLDLTDQTDLEHFESYVRGQVRELTSVALKQGHAIGVGHNKKTTLKVLKDLIPDMEKKGIKIVPLKELVR